MQPATRPAATGDGREHASKREQCPGFCDQVRACARGSAEMPATPRALAMTAGTLPGSSNRANATQRARRAKAQRIDYYPNHDARSAMDAKLSKLRPGSVEATNSGVLNAIVVEWAVLTGINKQEISDERREGTSGISGPLRTGARAGAYESGAESPDLNGSSHACVHANEFGESGALRGTLSPECAARAQESGGPPGISTHIAGARAGAYEFGRRAMLKGEKVRMHSSRRVVCEAKRHRDGQPCQAKSEPGKRRCRFHGGRSTGPRTDEGKAKALGNLKQNRASQSVGPAVALDPSPGLDEDQPDAG